MKRQELIAEDEALLVGTRGQSPLKRRILGAKLTERNNAGGEAHLEDK